MLCCPSGGRCVVPPEGGRVCCPSGGRASLFGAGCRSVCCRCVSARVAAAGRRARFGGGNSRPRIAIADKQRHDPHPHQSHCHQQSTRQPYTRPARRPAPRRPAVHFRPPTSGAFARSTRDNETRSRTARTNGNYPTTNVTRHLGHIGGWIIVLLYIWQ